MSLNIVTDRIILAARNHGVSLPGAVEDAFSLSTDLPSADTVEAEAVAEIAAAFGARDYAKRRDAALVKVASAHAADRLRARVGDALSRRRWDVIVEHADAIVEGFRAVVADDVATLNKLAPRVPATATATSIGLSADAYRARLEALEASERLLSVAATLAPIYSGAGNGPVEKHRLMLTAPPSLDGKGALGLREAFHGTRSITTASGQDRAPGLWFAIVANNYPGATFRLATRQEYRESFAALTRATEAEKERRASALRSAGVVVK